MRGTPRPRTHRVAKGPISFRKDPALQAGGGWLCVGGVSNAAVQAAGSHQILRQAGIRSSLIRITVGRLGLVHTFGQHSPAQLIEESHCVKEAAAHHHSCCPAIFLCGSRWRTASNRACCRGMRLCWAVPCLLATPTSPLCLQRSDAAGNHCGNMLPEQLLPCSLLQHCHNCGGLH